MKKRTLCLVAALSFAVMNSCFAFAKDFDVCFGRDFEDGGQYNQSLDTRLPTIYASDTLTEMGFDSTAFTQPSYNQIKGKNSDRSLRMSSSILYFNGEGVGGTFGNIRTDADRVAFWRGTNHQELCGVTYNGTINDFYELINSNFEKSKLVVLMACRTATMGMSLRDMGANSVVSFHKNIRADDAKIWSNRFMDAIASGDSIGKAADYANKHSGYYDKVAISDNRIDNPSVIITTSRESSQREYPGKVKTIREDENGNEITEYVDAPKKSYSKEHEPLDYDIPDNITFDFNSKDTTKLQDYIKNNIDENFDITKFNIDITSMPERGSIFFTLMIDGYKSNGYYGATYENEKITSLYKANIIDYTAKIAESRQTISDDEIRQMALDDNPLIDYGYEVIEQTLEKRIDLTTKKTFIDVTTTYQHPEYLGIQCMGYEYELSDKIYTEESN